MEDSVANTPVEVKKASPAVASVPDVWHSFRSEMDRLFDRFFSPYGMPSLRRVFDLDPGWRSDTSFSFAAPAIDLGEDDRAYKITAELRGLEAKDLDVSIAGDTLLIKGEKRQETEQKDKNYHVTQRAYGSFQRAFALPDGVVRDKITADLSKGVLTLTLPKTQEAQKPARKIDIKASG